MKKRKYVYFFGAGKAEGKAAMKNILGGKGANLAEMTNIGIPVPPGFTISAEVCDYFYGHSNKYPPELGKQIDRALAELEKATDMRFGHAENPLLVSVRSGAAVSMPGMMDTVLNLGLNPDVLQGIIKKSGNPRFAWDIYRRFINMFGDVVMGMEHSHFEEIMDAKKKEVGAKVDTDLNADDLKDLCFRYMERYKADTGEDFPTDPRLQLQKSIDAVFGSWNNPRAIKYRQIHEIRGLIGTAVNVQAMVFGNMGKNCATGVAFTRDPATGKNKFYGEFLVNAQGEDVVAGIRTPLPIDQLKRIMPRCYKELLEIKNLLERHYADVQDLEFTIQEGKLYLLQTRTGKRTAKAAVKIAVDMVREKLIDKEEALRRIDPNSLDQLLHRTFAPGAKKDIVARGLPASPGAAVGRVYFDADTAEQKADAGEKVVLVRIETSPEDIGGMNVAEGILTTRGGMTSHAAVVARGMGKCCVAGCGDIHIDYRTLRFTVNGRVVKAGDYISLDGSTGEVMVGEVETTEPELGADFKTLMRWADAIRKLKIRTNADTPHDALVARDFGAEGIGLTRTEHMFFEGDRIIAMRQMILADDSEGRKKALEKLLPLQRGDFEGIFEAMKALPVTIRLLDPPLHEFLPQEEENQKEMAAIIGVDAAVIKQKVASLHELNPMLGHRGCRLSITYPEICEMQTRAIIEAACNVKKRGIRVLPEIMVPLIGTAEEISVLKKIIDRVAKEVMKEKNVRVKYMVGTMIEIPRASLTADKIAEVAEFFSFGTNDLTQMTYGFSRDDVGTFVPEYIKQEILPNDPFQVLDREGVGQLVEMGIVKGRSARPDLKVGICGEHGGEPASVKFCHRVGMNYVSCSPFRVPIARLAAAQAVLEEKKIRKKAMKSKRKASKSRKKRGSLRAGNKR